MSLWCSQCKICSEQQTSKPGFKSDEEFVIKSPAFQPNVISNSERQQPPAAPMVVETVGTSLSSEVGPRHSPQAEADGGRASVEMSLDTGSGARDTNSPRWQPSEASGACFREPLAVTARSAEMSPQAIPETLPKDNGLSVPESVEMDSAAPVASLESGTEPRRSRDSAGRSISSVLKNVKKSGTKLFTRSNSGRESGPSNVMTSASPPRAEASSASKGISKVGSCAARQRKKPSGNANMPQDYRWLQTVLESIGNNRTRELGCKDAKNGKAFMPLFLLVGMAPSMLAGMQAVMFVADDGGKTDFWYIKPRKGSQTELETQTLLRHTKGPHKNDPGSSKKVLQPFADLLAGVWESPKKGGGPRRRFFIDIGSGVGCARAALEEDREGGPSKTFLTMLWVEDWSSPLSFKKKSVSGKLVYQRDPFVPEYQSRQFKLVEKDIIISEVEEPPFPTALPPDTIKDLFVEKYSSDD